VLDVQLFRAAVCDTDHYLVVAKIWERLAVSKQTMHRVHTKRFNLKKLMRWGGKEQYHIEISNRFSSLENSDDEVDIKRAWETMRENTNISTKESIGFYELKKHKPWFNKGCSIIRSKERSQTAVVTRSK
jgi:hypothetical protein